METHTAFLIQLLFFLFLILFNSAREQLVFQQTGLSVGLASLMLLQHVFMMTCMLMKAETHNALYIYLYL